MQADPDLILADVTASITIRNNRFRCDRGWDIDLDDGSSNYHIYNNLCLNRGIKLREGFYRVVENNIIVNNSLHPHVWFKNSGDVFARNIVMTPYCPIAVNYWGSEIDYNIFADSIALEKAWENGTDKHSIVYSLTFRNPQVGDYRIIDPTGTVFRAGFKNFAMDSFGVVSARLKKLARQPRMPIPVLTTIGTSQNGTSQAKVVFWQGLRLKNLETLGERSATGMDSERGVYVVSSESMGNALRDFIRPNDVILSFGGIAVNCLDDLRRAIKTTDLAMPQKLTIFRAQKENTIVLPANIIKKSDH